MNRLWLDTVTLGLCAVLGLAVLTACASDGPRTLEGIWKEYVEAYRTYHRNLYRFGKDRWPDMEPVMRIQKNYEMAEITLRDRQFHFLKNNYPERLRTDLTIHDLVHFEWSDRYDTAFFQQYPRARKLSNRVRKLKQKMSGHPAMPTLRKRFQSLPSDSRYATIRATFRQRLDRLDQALDKLSEN